MISQQWITNKYIGCDTNMRRNAYALGVGVYISRVEEGSVAERAGLRPGDSILEVNGTPFTAISHEEALKVGLCLYCIHLPFTTVFNIHTLSLR